MDCMVKNQIENMLRQEK